MKFNYLFLGIAIITLASFSKENTAEKYTPKVDVVFQFSDGEKLIAKSDCIGCHKLDKKLIGPSYLEIANKYAANEKNISYLSNKIIKGGSGVWGTVPMGAHASMKKDEAKTIAKYILSLKK
ncbi:c-type cytochrome [Flavobacterium acetivorans]|uniref:c-type cytochrome n=1 Tax=Flavobacterium acetivorans TaxID=2893883 RepID=UPI001E370493|nr:c-type cytochrome [Flavobacterium sp. F-29]UFH34850.1 c-type cytochrome [Flavobacterium sp. F-29]